MPTLDPNAPPPPPTFLEAFASLASRVHAVGDIETRALLYDAVQARQREEARSLLAPTGAAAKDRLVEARINLRRGLDT